MWYKLFVFPQNGHRLTVDASLALFCGNFFYVRTANTNLHYLTPFNASDLQAPYVRSSVHMEPKYN